MIVPVIMVCNEEYWLPYVLEASRGHFDRYVIYDIGSTDRTREVLDWWCDTSDAEIWRRDLPMCDPRVQGALRNSMISEARSDYYLILDGDEIYTESGYQLLRQSKRHMSGRHLYGIVKRLEWSPDLRSTYGLTQRNKHHRVYRRLAVFTGTHPGEAPLHKITPRNEVWIEGIECHHMHHADRSPMDRETPGRMARRDNPTYHRGDCIDADLLDMLPLLRKPIEDFAVAPALAELQR